MKFDNIILFAIQGTSGREEVTKGVAALKLKNTEKSRRVCVVHCETKQSFNSDHPELSTSVAVIVKTDPGDVSYDEPIGIYVVAHITAFPDNFPDLLQEHLRKHARGKKVEIGYLCLVVCNLAASKPVPLPKTIPPDGGDPHEMAKLIRGLFLKGLVPARVSAYDTSVFIHYDADHVPAGQEEGLSYEGRKYTALVTGGKPGHFHDYPRARKKHKLQWTFHPSAGAYRMGGAVEDVVLSVDVLTTTVSSHPVVSPRPTIAPLGRRAVWVPDTARPDCWKCGRAFGTFTRRHHCRQCGEVFCDACSSRKKHVNRPVPEPGKPPLAVSNGPVKVCEDCFHTI